jgi:hypothetical protein
MSTDADDALLEHKAWYRNHLKRRCIGLTGITTFSLAVLILACYTHTRVSTVAIVGTVFGAWLGSWASSLIDYYQETKEDNPPCPMSSK